VRLATAWLAVHRHSRHDPHKRLRPADDLGDIQSIVPGINNGP